MYQLALSMLRGDRAKFLGVILGIALSSFLITQLLSLFAGMMQRTHAFVSDVGQADIWVSDPAVEYVDEVAGLSETTLQRVRGVKGVEWAVPLYSGTVRARLPGGRFRAVQLVGLDDATLTGGPPEMLSGSLAALRDHDAVIVDDVGAAGLLSVPAHPDNSRSPLQLAGTRRPLAIGDEFLINDRRAVVAGIARVSPRFLARPTLYTTYSRALSIVPAERNQLAFVLVRAASNTDPHTLARHIEASTGLKARTHRDFAADTVRYYIRNTDVLTQVGFMVTLGTVVGLAISGQLLYLFTYDNLRHYAALKAMGLTNTRLAGMIAGQSLYAATLGFGLGLGAACLMGTLMLRTGMPFHLVWQTPVAVGAVTLLIATLAGIVSGLRAMSTEPATVFKA